MTTTGVLLGCGATVDGLDLCLEYVARIAAADRVEAHGGDGWPLRDAASRHLEVALAEQALRERSTPK